MLLCQLLPMVLDSSYYSYEIIGDGKEGSPTRCHGERDYMYDEIFVESQQSQVYPVLNDSIVPGP